MKSVVRALGRLVAGCTLVLPGSVHAQRPAVKWADLVGTWEQALDLGTMKAGPLTYQGSLLSHVIAFRPDSTVLMTQVSIERGDTFSCTGKPRVLLAGDTAKGMPISANAVNVGAIIHLKGQQLLLTSLYEREGIHEGETRVYRRIDASKQPLQHIVASGFASGSPVPAHASPPAGTLADLVGAWERIPDPTDSKGLTRQLWILRSDSTDLLVNTYKDGNDTLACGAAHSNWRSMERQLGDSIITYTGMKKSGQITQWAVLQGQRLTRLVDEKPAGVYRALDLHTRP